MTTSLATIKPIVEEEVKFMFADSIEDGHGISSSDIWACVQNVMCANNDYSEETIRRLINVALVDLEEGLL